MADIKKRTASTIAQVRTWVETCEHHIVDGQEEGFVLLKGFSEQLRVPREIWRQCYVIASVQMGSKHDNRFYRWDHEAEFRAAWPLNRADALRKATRAVEFHDGVDDDAAREAFGTDWTTTPPTRWNLATPLTALEQRPRIDVAKRLLRAFNERYHAAVDIRAIPYPDDMDDPDGGRQILELFIVE